MRRKRNNKKIMLLGLLLLVLSLSIGFAYLTQVLQINSTAQITKTNWDIHFENVVVREGSVEGTYPIIDESRTTVSLTVSLAKPKDFYEYEVDIVNAGSMDAKVENIEITTLTETQAKYLNYEVVYKDGTTINKNDLLKVGEKETIKVRVEFKDVTDPADLPDSTETIEFICKVIYGQDDGSGTKKPFDIETAPILASESVFTSAIADIKNNTKTITFHDEIDIPENAIGSADISDKQNGGVIAYWVPNSEDSTLYDLYIEGDGALYANPNSSSYFKDFSQVTTIEGADKLDMSLVTNMTSMFENCSVLTTLKTSYWDLSNVIYMNGLFSGCSALTALDTSNWDLSNVTSLHSVFKNCSALTTLDTSNWVLSNVTNMISTFSGCSSLSALNTSNWDLSNVIYMNGLFSGCSALIALDTSNWDLSNVTYMDELFSGCSALTALDTSNWDLSNVTSLPSMFKNCSALTTLDTSNWDLSNVIYMKSMFYNCSALTALDTSNWVLSNVIDMNSTFASCSALTALDTSNWDLSRVMDMGHTFSYCRILTTLGDTSNWNLNYITYMDYTFQYCHKLTSMTLNIKNRILENTTGMFSGINHKNGEQIILNYKKAAESIVNNIIANKPSTANIVKGTLIQ